MRIQLASDLHLEERPKTTFLELLEPGAAPILALLGDVAPLDHPNLVPFLEWCSERWETILWVPGCLELMDGGTEFTAMVAAIDRMHELAAPFMNIIVFNKDGMISSDGIYIFGLPFWKFPRDGTQLWHPQFFRWVEAEPSPMPLQQQMSFYHSDVEWVKERARAQKEPVVILSHTGPTPWLQEETFAGDPDKSMTVPEIEDLLRPPIVAWLCGHCHQSVNATKEWSDATGQKGSVLLATNPRGFPLENLEYRRDCVIRIDPTLFRRG